MNYDLSLPYAFLPKLVKNNNREWFAKHKPEYLAAHAEIITFADALLAEIQTHDHIETPTGKKSLYRIYRDVRFSKDKTPYSDHFSGGFRRATKYLRGGYYFHIQPGNSYVSGGFWGPNPPDLLHIRRQIAQDPEYMREVISSPIFKKTFGTLLGTQLKTSPKGFSIDDPAIDLLRYKQFIVRHHFSDKDVLGKDFHKKMNNAFLALRPFLDYMTDILITDLNGSDREDL